jgi:hypothetical protein
MAAPVSAFAHRFRSARVLLRKQIRRAKVVFLHVENVGLVVKLLKKDARHLATNQADQIQAEFTEVTRTLRLYPLPF